MPNVKWRAKTLPLGEWAALEEQFADFQLAAGSPPNLAMFSVKQPGEIDSTIYLTGPGIATIEALSPGGWEDAEAPSGSNVELLVGEGDPWSLFNINKPA